MQMHGGRCNYQFYSVFLVVYFFLQTTFKTSEGKFENTYLPIGHRAHIFNLIMQVRAEEWSPLVVS